MELLSLVVMAMATLPRDLKMSYDYMETMSRVNYWWWRDYKVHELFDQVTAENRHKIAFQNGHEAWSFYMLQEYSWQVANYFHSEGLQPGDVVAQVGVAGPRAVGLWLGLSRLGVVTAILPSDLPATSMVQAASSVLSKAIICDPGMVEDLQRETLPGHMTILSMGPFQDKSVKNLRKELAGVSSNPPRNVKTSVDDKLLYLFSPDTLTPIPVTNYRYIFIATTLHKTLDLEDEDILYSPLPQHQPEGSIVGTGQAVIFGNSVVSKGEFDPNTFFPNCDHYGATVALYNEDIVQKLLAIPPTAAEANHRVRLVVGKGLRDAQTWAQFKERFKVDRIGEYYGSVDSENYNMVNSYNKAGSVGFLPWFAFPLYQIHLISYDPNTGGEVRNKDGLCVSSENGEPGILLDKLPDDFERTQFSKNKNVIKDVFKKGDAYINTGDILVKDDYGYFYLVDTVAGIKRKIGQTLNPESSSQLQDINLESQTQTNSGPLGHVDQIPVLKEVSNESNVKLDYHSFDEGEDYVPAHDISLDVQISAEQFEEQQPQTESRVKRMEQPNDKEFKSAAKAVENNGKELSNEKKLELYGLYKQATLGTVNTARPSRWQLREVAKWDAWKSNENMTKDDAMKKYIELARSLGYVK